MKEKILVKINELKDWSKTRPETREVKQLISKAKEFIQSIRNKKDETHVNLNPQ